MRESRPRGLPRARSSRTTRPAADTSRLVDLVKRDFTTTRVSELRVAGITYVRTAACWVHATFVLDVAIRPAASTRAGCHRR
ncbi:hypothetical protein [Saccharothrix coeruleofusca]|nr:hypothetical protein [Saccharothrix coeruleofusca]